MAKIRGFLNSFTRIYREQTSNWRRSFKLIWGASRFYTIAWSVLLVVQGVLPGLLVYLTKLVVDSLSAAINSQGDWSKIRPSLFYLGAVGVLLLLSDLIQSILETVRAAQADIIQDYIKKLIHDKSAVTDMEHYESSDFHDRLEQATTDGASRPLSLLESMGSLVQNTITLLVMAGLLLQYSLMLPLILLISTIPAFLVVLRFDRNYHRWWRSTTWKRRWTTYYDTILTHSSTAAEIRAYNLNGHFQNYYQKIRTELRLEKLSQMRRLGIAKLFSGVLSLVILAAAVGWFGVKALYGTYTLGDLALFYQAFQKGQGLVRTLFKSFSDIIKNSLFLSSLFEFLDLKSKIIDPPSPVAPPVNLKLGIKFNNLTFSYPGTKKNVFEDFSLFLPAGKVIAVVGENGSGKSTLIKLLCRFYDPQSGSIEFDGIDIRNFAVSDLLRMSTITFQLPIHYHATVGESIAMGDVEAGVSDEDIEKAAKGAGAHEFIARFSEKYNTMLGKIHSNGVDLSGGEWQRLALARAYYRKAPIVLLDEPTSFMDSWSESDWFERFRKLTHGKTSLIITHRFTIAMRADIIYVMRHGKIIEKGTHQELLALNGHYAESWRSQMKASEDFVNPDEQSSPLEYKLSTVESI